MGKANVDHIVARASIAYQANHVALEHPDEIQNVHEEELSTTAEAAQAGLPESQKQTRHGLPSSKSLKNLRTAAAHTVNLRDCGSISSILRQGRMFRSSQVMRYRTYETCTPYTRPNQVHVLVFNCVQTAVSYFVYACSAAEISKLGIKVYSLPCKRVRHDLNGLNPMQGISYTNRQHPVQSVLDLRIMRKDCKMEAKVFDNSLEEIAYTVGQVSCIFDTTAFALVLLDLAGSSLLVSLFPLLLKTPSLSKCQLSSVNVRHRPPCIMPNFRTFQAQHAQHVVMHNVSAAARKESGTSHLRSRDLTPNTMPYLLG